MVEQETHQQSIAASPGGLWLFLEEVGVYWRYRYGQGLLRTVLARLLSFLVNVASFRRSITFHGLDKGHFLMWQVFSFRGHLCIGLDGCQPYVNRSRCIVLRLFPAVVRVDARPGV